MRQGAGQEEARQVAVVRLAGQKLWSAMCVARAAVPTTAASVAIGHHGWPPPFLLCVVCEQPAAVCATLLFCICAGKNQGVQRISSFKNRNVQHSAAQEIKLVRKPSQWGLLWQGAHSARQRSNIAAHRITCSQPKGKKWYCCTSGRRSWDVAAERAL